MKSLIFKVALLSILLFTYNSYSQVYILNSNLGTINTCSGTFYDSGGEFGVYGNSENYTVTFCSDNADPIIIDFTSFDLESNYDYLTIYDGPDIFSPQVPGSPFDGSSPMIVSSSGTCLTINFSSDGSVTYDGWAADISCSAPSCFDGIQNQGELGIDCGGPCPVCPPIYNMQINNGQTITTCDATLYDSGGSSGIYGNNEDYTVTFCSDSGNCIEIDFISMNVESCCDHIYVYDGSSILATLLGIFQGTTPPANLTSSGGCITIRFTSDGSVTPDGFQINIICTDSCYVPPPPPNNDTPCDAYNLTVGAVCNYTTYTTDPATNSTVPPPSCGTYNGGDVWFTATVPASGRLTVDIDALLQTEGEIAIYYGPDCNNLTELHCANSTWAVPMPSINVITSDGLANQTVWIRVWEPGNDNQGTFNICAYETPPPPPNNEPCGAYNLTVGSICNFTTYSTESATGSSVPDPSCEWDYNGGDVWFTATVPASGLLAIGTGTGVITWGGLAIYSGTDCNNLTEIHCIESTWQMPSLFVYSIDGLANQTVWIRFWEPYNDIQGTFDICAYEPPPTLEVDTVSYTPEELVQNVLITGCLQAFNVTYTGHPTAIGFFNSVGTPLGFNYGVILASGEATNAIGPNDESGCTTGFGYPGDADLDAIISPDFTNDAAVLEFDFIPSSDTTEFNFIFGSEEYPEYVGSFNDVFAFLLTGPNPSGPAYVNYNIALIPGTTTPVSIYNVNNGTSCPTTGPCVNCAYYIDQCNSGFSIQYDGLTEAITALAYVIPCETYHIKIGIADANDNILDSGVLLEMGSFTSGGEVDMSHYSFTGDNQHIYEGCENYYIFSRLDTTDLTDSVLVQLNISGTASLTDDITNFPTSFYISAGEIYDTIFYSAILDGLPEGIEYIVFSLENGCPCFTTTVTDTIFVHDSDSLVGGILNNDTTINLFQCVDLISYVNLAPSVISYLWSTSDTTGNINVCPTFPGTTYYLEIFEQCGQYIIDSVTINVYPEIGPYFIADDICFGDTATIIYTGTIDTSTTLTWDFFDSGANPGTIILNTGDTIFQVIWDTEGVKPITVIATVGIFSESFTDTVLVKPVPTTDFITGEILCLGENLSVTFTGLASDSAIFNWDFDGATILSGSGAGPYTITWGTDGNYTVSLISVTDNGCISAYPTNIDINVPLTITISIATIPAHCNGDCNGYVEVTPSGGTLPYAYTWSTPEGNSSSGIITNLCATGSPYTVTVTDNNGCNNFASFNIIEPPLLVGHALVISNVTCHGKSNGSATITVSGGVPPYSYLWSNFTTNQIIENITAGIYTVDVTDYNNCTLTGSVEITQPPKLIVITSNVSICKGDTAIISATALGGTSPYLYTWNSGTYFGETITVNPAVTTTYTVTAIDTNGCESNLGSATVNIYPPITAILSTDNDSICPGESTTLLADISGGNGGPYTCVLQNGDTVAIPFDVYPPVIGATNYMLTVSDACELLENSNELTITIMPAPPNSFSSDIIYGCQPLTVYFNESSPDSGQTYYWDFGDDDNNFSYLKNPSHFFENYGTYNIKLIVTSSFGCENTVTKENMIEVYPKPEAQFIASSQTISIIKPIIYFDNLSSYTDTSYWVFGDGDSSNARNPEHTYNTVGTYTIELIVASDHGCRDTIYGNITVKDEFTFYAPTAFTPGSDNTNNTFIPVGEGIDPDNFQMIIYDRWGEKVFETFDIDHGWDGKIKKGKKIGEAGVYTWMVIYKNLLGAKHEETGFITLIR